MGVWRSWDVGQRPESVGSWTEIRKSGPLEETPRQRTLTTGLGPGRTWLGEQNIEVKGQVARGVGVLPVRSSRNKLTEPMNRNLELRTTGGRPKRICPEYTYRPTPEGSRESVAGRPEM